MTQKLDRDDMVYCEGVEDAIDNVGEMLNELMEEIREYILDKRIMDV